MVPLVRARRATMAKLGQHDHDASGPRSGRNEPTKSVPITAGTPKKRETYEEQAGRGKDTDPRPQLAEPEASTNDHREDGDHRARKVRSGRSGSDSNADGGTRGH
jgi:hypothetical protein